MENKFLNAIIRWLLMLPATFLSYNITFLLLNMFSFFIPGLSSDGIIIKYLYKAPISFLSGYYAIYIATLVVKSNKKIASIIAAIFMTSIYFIASVILRVPSQYTSIEIQIIGFFTIIGFIAGVIWRDSLFSNQNNS
jgi:hypothetical protein